MSGDTVLTTVAQYRQEHWPGEVYRIWLEAHCLGKRSGSIIILQDKSSVHITIVMPWLPLSFSPSLCPSLSPFFFICLLSNCYWTRWRQRYTKQLFTFPTLEPQDTSMRWSQSSVQLTWPGNGGSIPCRKARSPAAWPASGSWGGWARRNVRLKQRVYKKEAALRGSGEGDLGICGGTESSGHAQDEAGWWAFWIISISVFVWRAMKHTYAVWGEVVWLHVTVGNMSHQDFVKLL